MPRPLTLDAPLDCTIRVAGALDARWSDRLGGVRLRGLGRALPVTELSGRLLDQAALLGVLVTLYDLGLPLLSVSCRAAEGPPDAAQPPSPRRTRAKGMGAPAS
jgi:hypothetical protein